MTAGSKEAGSYLEVLQAYLKMLQDPFLITA